MTAKYIIIQHANTEVPIVFSALLSHVDVAKLSGLHQVKSAGFCELDGTGKWTLGGWSDTLNLSPRPQDVEILKIHIERSPVSSKQ